MKFGVRLAARHDTMAAATLTAIFALVGCFFHHCTSLPFIQRFFSLFIRLRLSCCRLNAQKELQAAANEDPAGEYIDYKLLKQILGQLTPLYSEPQSEGDAQVRAVLFCARCF